MGLFDTGVATLGQILGLPEMGISEKLSGSNTQTQPLYTGSGIAGSGGYITSPISGNASAYPISGGVYQSGPSQGQTAPVVAGAQTSATVNNSSGGGGGGGDNALQALLKIQNPNPSQQSEIARLQAEIQNGTTNQQNTIGGAWDAYTNQLNDMLNSGLSGQKAGQEQQVQGSYDQALNQLGTQQTSSTNQVNQQQASSLKDLGENIKNLFQSGNQYLGARGAGDSTAANQYAYALTKMGTKARGDILNQVNQRKQQIGDIYNSEKNNLDAQKTTQLGQIAQWFSQAQNALRQQIGQAGVSKASDINALSQNLLNQALQAKQQVESQIANQQNVLQTWAANNSKTVQELISKMQSVYANPMSTTALEGAMPNSQGQYSAPLIFGNATNTQNIDPLTGLPKV